MRALVLALVSCFGCGRLNFDRIADAAPAGPPDDAPSPDAPVDLPAVPEQICKVTHLPATTPPSADLAIAATSEGYAAIWVNTQDPTDAYAIRLDADHQQLAALPLDYLTDTRLSGLLEVGSRLLIASATGTVETLRSVSPELAALPGTATRSDVVPSHDPFAVNVDNTRRAWVSGGGGDFELALIADDGTQGPVQPQPVRHTKQNLACTNGPAHGHCAWSQESEPGNPVECVIADIDFDRQPMIQVDTSYPFTGECSAPRIAQGNGAVDSIVVWTTTSGGLKGLYPVRDPKLIPPPPPPPIDIAPSGSAPKVQFDGVRFWIAWLDNMGALQLTSFGLDSQVTTHEMAGWVPNGPEAFELARRPATPGADNAEVVLAVLHTGGLDLLTICPP